MRVLIVDDEAPARAKLRRMLGTYEDLEVVGEAANGLLALQENTRLEPDAIFIDVQMPEVDGFDVAASLPDDGPVLVFVTAFDRYALRAFDTRACDYLLKPVDPTRLERAVQRVREKLVSSRLSVHIEQAKTQSSTPTLIKTPDTPSAAPRDTSSGAPQPTATTRQAGTPTQLMIADRGQVHIVRCADIVWLESADNYVHVYSGGRALLMRRTLTALLEDLGPAFVRVHRGAAVALAAVQSVRSRGKGDAVVVLLDGREVACSRQYRVELLERLRR